MEDYEEFRKSKLKVHGEKHFKITGSLGVKDAYRWLRKNKWPGIERPLTESEFYSIIREVNNYLAAELAQGNEILLPQRMGLLEVRKVDTYVKFVDGKLRTNRGIDWKKTLQLWHQDKQAEEEKLLIRKENKENFTIFYNRITSNYINKTFYQFRPHRAVVLELAKNIEDGTVDAYKLY